MGGHTAGKVARSPAATALNPSLRAAQLTAQLAAAAQDGAAAEAALAALPALGAAGLPGLQQLCQNPDPNVRWWAVRALSALQLADAVPILISCLQDAAEMVQAAALLALGSYADARAAAAVGGVLAGGSSYLVRQAGDALRQMGAAGEAELIAALRHPHQATRMNAARALAFTDGQQAIAPLFAALDDDSAAVCYWVEQALERRGTGMVYFQP